MDKAAGLLESIRTSFSSFLQVIVDFLPSIVAGLVLLLIGWVIARSISFLVRKSLKAAGFDGLSEKIGLDKILNKLKIEKGAAWLVGRMVYWLILLVFFTATADFLGWDMVTNAISAVFAYLPTLLVALVIVVLGLFIAERARALVKTTTESIGISGARAISNIVYYLILIIVIISALDQAGVDTTLVTSHLTILFGGILVAFAIAYGIGARDIVGNMLSSYYGKGKYREGQVLKIDEVEGEVVQIDNLSITLQVNDEKVVFPTQVLINKTIRIIKDVEQETE